MVADQLWFCAVAFLMQETAASTADAESSLAAEAATPAAAMQEKEVQDRNMWPNTRNPL